MSTEVIEESMAPVSSDTEDISAQISSAVQFLTLPVGIYAFTVKNGPAPGRADVWSPSLQVALSPNQDRGLVEFVSGPATVDRWLRASGDVVVVKITGGEATLLLTSLRHPQSTPLSVDVRRLDVAEETEAPAEPAEPADESRVVTLVHLPYLGDLTFADGWAGKPADNLWIEGFAVQVEEPQLPEVVEYCGVNEHGDVSDWVTDGVFCGTRGTGVPLVAFAMRLKEAAQRQYSCRYRGRFLSGAVIGPIDNGQFCRSEAPGDPLVAMEVLLAPGSGAAPGR
jgi:hypothetical protein